MNRKHLAILAAAGFVWSVSAVHAADGMSRLVATGTKAGATNDDTLKNAGPTDLSAEKKKKKGRGGRKGGKQQPYMTIKMKDAQVSSYRSSRGGRPKRSTGSLLGTSDGNFNPNPPAPTGTRLPPP